MSENLKQHIQNTYNITVNNETELIDYIDALNAVVNDLNTKQQLIIDIINLNNINDEGTQPNAETR